jgi:AcrR family transcriptional regulator
MPTAAGALSPTKGEQTRRAILDAAIPRFGREGFRATSVADIARDAKVGSTVAYAYFADKESLFLAALDEDAAAVINEALSAAFEEPDLPDWREMLFFTLVDAVERHPLARRLLAGLEPDVTARVLEIPALTELRKACAERLRTEQVSGAVRADIDPVAISNGIVAIMLALLMSVVQLGAQAAGPYTHDVAAVFAAAIERAPGTATPPRRRHRSIVPS